MQLTQDQLIKTIQNLAQQVSQLSIDKAILGSQLEAEIAENAALKQQLEEVKKGAIND